MTPEQCATLKDIALVTVLTIILLPLGIAMFAIGGAIVGYIGAAILAFIGSLWPFVLAAAVVCVAADMYLRRQA